MKQMKCLKRITGDDLLSRSLVMVILCGEWGFFEEYAKILGMELKKLGIKVCIMRSLDEDFTEQPDVILAIGAPQFGKSVKKYREKGVLCCALLTEQLGSRKVGNLKRADVMNISEHGICRYYDILFDWSITNCEILRKWHKNVVYVPFGYYDKLEIADGQCTPKEYDIFFVGGVHNEGNRRKKLLDSLSNKYKVYPKTVDLWDTEVRGLAIAKSKICLNIHFDYGLNMESPRLYEYFACKSFVLSEPMLDSRPFVKGKDYDIFFWSNVNSTIDYYLENDNLRNDMSMSAYNVCRNTSIKQSAEIMLQAILTEFYYLDNINIYKKLKIFNLIQ